MTAQRAIDISRFYAIGINYKKSNATTRGLFAVTTEQYAAILNKATTQGLSELFILSTCNRTEIYGFGENAQQLITLLCSETKGDTAIFNKLAYIKSGKQAIQHLFEVSAGLDSQILGDYEIVGQIKAAVKFSKERGFIGIFIERLVNFVLQSSKAIKNETAISGGTISVSFAAVQYIREKVMDIADKKIILLGTGKIGRNTCKNLVDYLDTKNITLINRTEEKASGLAKELGLQYAPVNELAKQLASADVILVATNSTQPTILCSHLEQKGEKLIIDLSVPYNVELAARELSNITVVNIDELSKLKDETLARRQAEVPKAKAIITRHIAEFVDWLIMRRHAPILKAVKIKLKEIHTSPLFSEYTSTANFAGNDPDEKIQRVINGMASKIRLQNQGGCNYIEAINEFIASEAS
ncbi:MAG TPA: glutamyl-tRNA reductase [Chitinophagaceae bacterium]|nr:glutamyl-tRNA reductase [Chitinophagaceae bacterium]